MTQQAPEEGRENGDSILVENADSSGPLPSSDRVWIFGIPVAPLTMAETVRAICDLIDGGVPAYVITANTHYAMLSDQHVDLRVINERAAFLVADGAPLVWASRYKGQPLPERVAGSDLIFELSSAVGADGLSTVPARGRRGGSRRGGSSTVCVYPGLRVVGTECPSLQRLNQQEETALIARIRATKPDILLVAFGQPKGERWIYQHLDELVVPVSIQVGASLDFAAGMIRRARLEWRRPASSGHSGLRSSPGGSSGDMPVTLGSWLAFSLGIWAGEPASGVHLARLHTYHPRKRHRAKIGLHANNAAELATSELATST